ncbi:MAG: glycosyltransferase family 9 protein [Desulfovibrio sp.]|jgi:ADP-heptose:LPS heptosyltransferase|nr:glycosyltransferase family 9 protein [Desulfovibrio sp.]
MSADPLLVLQMQRMGDLILSFPLIEQLQRRLPGHPVWVAAEPQFFEELVPLAPKAVFFPSSHCARLAQRRYALAVNLSSRPDAARCLARLDAPLKLGPAALKDGLRIEGFWHLYRASLTQNNRHNAFHWADLYLLDAVESASLTRVGHARPRGAGGRRVGLMLGASEAAKRPDADFWARLARRLVRAQVSPVFLGGPAEMELGAEAAQKSGLPKANLCGRLSLKNLADVLRGLALFITPDTGPMHLADWVGAPVLNLSMGPVQARETGPRSPGQWILRADASCVGCWQCSQPRPRCRGAFTPRAVADVAVALLDRPDKPDFPPLKGLTLFKTGRDNLGLYSLIPHHSRHSCRTLLEDFWQAAFLHIFGALSGASSAASGRETALRRLGALQSAFPSLHIRLGQGLARLTAACSSRIKHPGELPAGFWREEMPLLRLFAGWMHMTLQNARYSREGWQYAVDSLELLGSLFADTKN